MSKPFRDALPVATTTAVGVANPKAQGQAITNTAIKLEMAFPHSGAGPTLNHKINVIIASTMTVGVKTPEILSAYL